MRNLLLTTISILAVQFCYAQSIVSSAITPAGTFYKA